MRHLLNRLNTDLKSLFARQLRGKFCCYLLKINLIIKYEH